MEKCTPQPPPSGMYLAARRAASTSGSAITGQCWLELRPWGKALSCLRRIDWPSGFSRRSWFDPHRFKPLGDTSMNTTSTQPAARTPIYNGEIQFRADVGVPAHEVWRALTDPTSLRCWFGDLNGELRPQHDARLDFGDGDFLVLRVLQLQEPNELAYLTRFLGIGPVSKISWSIVPQGSGSCIWLVADVAQRPEEAGEPPRPDWMALGDRLVRYVTSGEMTRRRPTDAIDASVELPVPIRQAWDSLFEGDNQREWLPINDPVLDIGS